jgi:hypothetical protein
MARGDQAGCGGSRVVDSLHIGGIVDPLSLFKNPSVALRVNVEKTINILECGWSVE